jgi:hypothetical protein
MIELMGFEMGLLLKMDLIRVCSPIAEVLLKVGNFRLFQ